MRKQLGFTLVEILIALAIFAIIGVVAAACLHQMIMFRSRVIAAGSEWRELNITHLILEQDINNIVVMPSNSPNANQTQAFLGNTDALSFTRWYTSESNLITQTVPLMKVSYHLMQNHLTRTRRDLQGHISAVTLLKNVNSIHMQYLDSHKKWYPYWPISSVENSLSNTTSVTTLPLVIKVTVQERGIGNVTWYFNRPVVSG